MSKPKKQVKKGGLNIAVIIAALSFIGSVLVAVINVLGNNPAIVNREPEKIVFTQALFPESWGIDKAEYYGLTMVQRNDWPPLNHDSAVIKLDLSDNYTIFLWRQSDQSNNISCYAHLTYPKSIQPLNEGDIIGEGIGSQGNYYVESAGAWDFVGNEAGIGGFIHELDQALQNDSRCANVSVTW